MSAVLRPTEYLDRPPFSPVEVVPVAPPPTWINASPVRLFMKRVGKFTVGQCQDDTTQCGFKGTRTLDYRVVIEGSPEHLTPEGFLIDNFAIQRYFDDTYKVVTHFLSCERIALKAVADIRRMVGTGCKAVEVTVDGTGVAGLTAGWRADGLDTPVSGAN
jgi:hypothetical protein